MTTPLLLTIFVVNLYQLYLQWEELSQGEDVMDYFLISAAQLFLLLYYMTLLRTQ